MMQKATRGPRRGRLVLAATLVVLALAGGCSSARVAQGDWSAGDGFRVTLERPWSDVTAWAGLPPHLRLLTQDGPLLNQVFVADPVPVGRALFSAASARNIARGRTRVPVVRPDMSELEQVEFVVDSLAGRGLADIAVGEVLPRGFADSEGVWFGYTARSGEGLDLAGQALVAQTPQGLRLMLFLAPREHYAAALTPEIERLFASARAGAGR